MSLISDLRFLDLKQRYQNSNSRNEKSHILDVACEYTRRHRKHLTRLFRRKNNTGKLKIRRGRPRHYIPETREIIVQLWKDTDFPWSKRMPGSMISEWIPHYEKYHNVRISETARKQLASIRPTLIDTILKPYRYSHARGLSLTRRQRSRFMDSVPVSDRPRFVTEAGYLEGDTVAHCGGSASGAFLSTLQTTDIATGWSCFEPVRGKSADEVKRAFNQIELRLPFDVKEFDSDCGDEFLNETLFNDLRCRKNPIRQTRSRPYEKNDNAYIEQKNSFNLRRTIGYDRYENEGQYTLLKQLYRNYLEKYTNIFVPNMKLISKEYVNGKCRRKFDAPQTPAQRVLACANVPEDMKRVVRNMQKTLNPYLLKKKIHDILKQLSVVQNT